MAAGKGQLIFTTEIVLPPHACLICGSMPMTEEQTPKPFPMAHVVGMDVNWGESIYICVGCIGVMADFIGRPDADRFAKLQKEHQSLQEQHADLVERYSGVTERVAKILGGKKAEKALREEVKS